MLPDVTTEIQTELKWKSWPVAKVVDTDHCSYKILLCHSAERCWLFLCVAEIRVEFESDLADSFLHRLILQFVTCERSGTGIQSVLCHRNSWKCRKGEEASLNDELQMGGGH